MQFKGGAKMFKLGNFELESSGITVIISENGAVGGVSVRGSAPATRETDLLRSENSVDKVNAVVLSGGSAFGLDACGGVMKYLKDQGIGYNAGKYNVPIVVGASLYDLEYGKYELPTADDGYKACENATKIDTKSGNIGAGRGATMGKILGMQSAVKSGLGMAEYRIGELYIIAVVAVNAFGNVYDYNSGKLIKGATFNGASIDIVEAIKGNLATMPQMHSNTTIGCILTNAKLTKTQANKLADIAHDGYAMTIRPVHTMVDGDAIFALADGEIDTDFMQLSCIAPTLMADAVISAVTGIKD